MSKRTTLFLSLSGSRPRELLRGLEQLGWLPANPVSLQVDQTKRTPGEGWVKTWLEKAKTLRAITDEGHSVTFDETGLVTLRRPDTEVGVSETCAALGKLPFELAVIGRVYAEWLDVEYQTYSFADGHATHGWACGFRGEGYRRLVSRRWLAFGPWRRYEIEDATWVEFHDLDEDPNSALAHAQPRWRRMGISDTGGFIQTGFQYQDDVRGVYDPTQEKLKVMVPSGPVSERKMLEIAAARIDPHIQGEKPIKRTAFVFLEEANARQHLHELWLREHECWAVVEGQERRLDEGYCPG